MEYTSRRLAMQVQSDLDEYLANNPDFPVRPFWFCLFPEAQSVIMSSYEAKGEGGTSGR